MICKLFSFLTAGALSCSSAGAKELRLGAPLPDVSCNDQKGNEISLSSYKEEAWTLVYFYPKADTPGCTKQACSLRDSYTALKEKGVKVIGVSTDSVASQKAFAEKYGLPFTLLADENSKVIKAFGVPKFPGVGLAKRQAYLFKHGKLVWVDKSASTKQQAEDILSFLQKHPALPKAEMPFITRPRSANPEEN